MNRGLLPPVFQNCRSKGLLIDANLLLLYFTGRANPELIRSFKPLRSMRFTDEDFSLLCQVMQGFGRILTTPNILTEVSNLSNKLPSQSQVSFRLKIAPLIQEIKEEFVSSDILARTACFPRFGLTDDGIIKLAPGAVVVLTMDHPLSNYLQKTRAEGLNFEDLRILVQESK